MEVLLEFDDFNGPSGLLHVGAADRGFDPFFNAEGVFHDIMEHYFEDVHPYFRGEYAFNFAGEIAANGHCAWYVHGLGLSDRLRDINTSIDEALYNSVSIGNLMDGRFGDRLKSRIPNRYKPHPNYSGILNHHWVTYDDAKQELPSGPLRSSLTYAKVAALYGWGYYTAKRIIPQNDHNKAKIQKMYNDIAKFVKYNDPEQLKNVFKYLKATVRPGKKFDYKLVLVDQYYRREHPLLDWEKSINEMEDYAE